MSMVVDVQSTTETKTNTQSNPKRRGVKNKTLNPTSLSVTDPVPSPLYFFLCPCLKDAKCSRR